MALVPGRRNPSAGDGAAAAQQRGSRYTLDPFDHSTDRVKKIELIEAVSQATGESQAATARTLEALIDVISREVAAGRDVAITGFGSFRASARAERSGRNPRTGEALTIAASRSVKFVPGAALKNALNDAG